MHLPSIHSHDSFGGIEKMDLNSLALVLYIAEHLQALAQQCKLSYPRQLPPTPRIVRTLSPPTHHPSLINPFRS